MKRVLVLLATLATLWIPDYLWAMGPHYDADLLSYTDHVYVSLNSD